MSSNSLYVCNGMLENVIIVTDTNGRNELNSLNKFKYQQRLLERSIKHLNNNSVLINETIHVNCIIIVDVHGNNYLENKDEFSTKNAEENDIFRNVLKQVHLNKAPTNIDELLLIKRESLQKKLKEATSYFDKKAYDKSSSLYKEILTMIETDTYPDEFMLKHNDIFGIKFAYILSKIFIGKPHETQLAIDILRVLVSEEGDEFPTIYYYLAECLCSLEKYQDAIEVLDTGLDKLKNLEVLTEVNWPGSDKQIISGIDKSALKINLETLLKHCKEFRLPDLKCIFSKCQNKDIFCKSASFKGYVLVKCSKKCSFSYHRNCWKMKLEVDGIKKPSCFLKSLCATDGCSGSINEILLFDKNLHVNNAVTAVIPVIPEEKKSNDKKSKKKNMTSKVEPKIISDTNKNVKQKKKVEKIVPQETKSKKQKKKKASSNSISKEDVSNPMIAPEKNEKEESYMFSTSTNDEDKNAYVSIVKYSGEDKVSVDFTFDENPNSINKKLTKINEENSKMTQTDINKCPNPDTTREINAKLKQEVSLLQSQLLQSEAAYNIVVAQHNELQKKYQDTLVEQKQKQSDKCIKLEKVIRTKEDENSISLEQLKRLEQWNSELTNKLKKSEITIQSLMREKQTKNEEIENLTKFISILKSKIDDLSNQNVILSQQYTYVTQHDNAHLRQALFIQINNIREAYTTYFSTRENKSNQMISLLEEIKALSTPDTVPSLAEVEENLAEWKDTLYASVEANFLMNGFYTQVFKQFSNEPSNVCPIAFPSFIVEPPNIFEKHFKYLMMINQKLEQLKQQQMNAFFKILSVPYQPKNDTFAEAVVENNQPNHSFVLHDINAENIPQFLSNTTNSSEESTMTANTVITNDFGDSQTPVNMYDSILTNTSNEQAHAHAHTQQVPRKITKQSTPILNDEEISSQKENIPNGAHCVSVSDTTTTSSPHQHQTSTQNVPKSKSKPNPNSNVVGLDLLVNKLHEKMPLIPVSLLRRAVHVLRQRYGCLSGRDSKQILVEIKEILKEIAIADMTRQNSKEKPAKTWNKVNNGIHWHNEDPEINCSICFEFMPPEKSTILRCQHIFHTICIKLWLQNDSICPICRAFTTLDDEFPPLK